MLEKYNILVLEHRNYYEGLLDFDQSIYNVTFGGLKLYKSNLKQFDLIVSFNFLSDLGNFMIIKAINQGVKTLLVSDGIIDWSNMFGNKVFKAKNLKLFHPILHDYFFCVGKNETSYFRSQGQETYSYVPKRMEIKNDIFSKKNQYDFLITTSNTPYHDEIEKQVLLKILNELVKFLNKYGYSFGFRIYDDFLKKKLKISETNNFTSGDFGTIFNNFKCLITTPSSIIITAMQFDKPVAQIIYRDTPLFVQSGWLITSLNIDSTLVSMHNKNRERMQFQSWQIQNYSPENDILSLVSSFKEKKIKPIDYDTRLFNLLNSKYNINFEYFFRKIYVRLKNINFKNFLQKKT